MNDSANSVESDGAQSVAADDGRAAFETWFSDGGQWPKAIERSSRGDTYLLAAAQSSWTAWQAAWRAALKSGVGALKRPQGHPRYLPKLSVNGDF